MPHLPQRVSIEFPFIGIDGDQFLETVVRIHATCYPDEPRTHDYPGAPASVDVTSVILLRVFAHFGTIRVRLLLKDPEVVRIQEWFRELMDDEAAGIMDQIRQLCLFEALI